MDPVTTALLTTAVITGINQAASKLGEDPILLQAMAYVESSYRPEAIGSLGEVGLYQLRPEFHPIKKGMGVKRQTEIAANYLKRMKASCGSKFLQCYNMGPSKALRLKFSVTNYETKVWRKYNEILNSRTATPDRGQVNLAESSR